MDSLEPEARPDEGVGGVTNNDLPSLYQAADRGSQQNQVTYLRILRLDLLALIAGALCASVSFESTETMRAARVVSALLLAAGLLLTLVLRLKNFERGWYGGRAAAESVKTTAWRYMIGAEPFPLDLDPTEADRQFAAALKGVLEQSEQLSVSLRRGGPVGKQITDRMREVRALPLNGRRDLYVRARIRNQQEWYGRKADLNAKWEGRSFTAVMLAQFLALAYAIWLVLEPLRPLNLAAVLSTVAAALLAWMQAKQYQELAQSYAVAEHELGIIADQAVHIGDEAALAAFVADAESAISREHTLWVARRDILPRRRAGT